jgi:hypothetical protein
MSERVVLTYVFLTNEQLILMHTSANTPVANSDHDSVCFSVLKPVDDARDKDLTLHFWLSMRDADFAGLNSYLRAYDWTQLLETNFTTDSLWASFCSVLQTRIYEYVQLSAAQEQSEVAYPANIRRAMAHKICLWK